MRMRFLEALRNSIREERRDARTSSKDFPRGSFAAYLLRQFELCPLVLNRFYDFADIQSHTLGLHHELLDLVLQGDAFRSPARASGISATTVPIPGRDSSQRS